MKISLLVPFRANSKRDPRIRSWEWLQQRWLTNLLPEAELCVGTDTGQPFSKAVAVNDAYSKSSGDLLVIADADSWVERPSLVMALEHAAAREHLVVPWFVSYRLKKNQSEQLMGLSPDVVLPVTKQMKDEAAGTGPAPDSCAMVIIMQRTAFERVGGFDPRFRGWGSEDVSFGLSCWTLLGRNRYCIGEAYALFHPQPMKETGLEDPAWKNMRVWNRDSGGMNHDLWHRYKAAQGYPSKMLELCREHPLEGSGTPISLAPTWRQEDMVRFSDTETKAFQGETVVVAAEPDVRGDAPVARETLY